jgi:hypothetical protein
MMAANVSECYGCREGFLSPILGEPKAMELLGRYSLLEKQARSFYCSFHGF